MHSLNELKYKLEQLVEFLIPFLPLANSHNSAFITEDHWNKYLPPRMRQDLMNLEDNSLSLISTATLFQSCIKSNFGSLNSDVALEEYLNCIRSLHAENLDIFTPLRKIQVNLIENEFSKLSRVMQGKKAYEVSHLCQIIASICQERKINQVVDIGCGIGNLSAVLLIRYQLNVVAVDASGTNIGSTLKRPKTIQKISKDLQKLNTKDVVNYKKDNITVGDKSLEAENKKKLVTDSKKVEVNDEKERMSEKGTVIVHSVNERDATSNKSNFIKLSDSKHKLIGVTKFVTEKEDLSRFLDTFIEEESSLCYKPSNDLCIVGLHTCGNLTPTSLKIYISNRIAKFICNISCCYHLLNEEFTHDTFHIDKFSPITYSKSHIDSAHSLDKRYESTDMDPFHQKCDSSFSQVGFPLSSVLKNRKFALGRNARNLAARAIHRLSSNDKNLKVLFWRALFEVMVIELNGVWPQNAFVGRVKNCTNFYDYCLKGLKKIGLNIKIDESLALKYSEKYSSRESEFRRFYFLEASLSPVIETLIHLDRLVYLWDEGFTNSHLVKIFDSSISPRCTAIISLK